MRFLMSEVLRKSIINIVIFLPFRHAITNICEGLGVNVLKEFTTVQIIHNFLMVLDSLKLKIIHSLQNTFILLHII